MQVKSIRAFVPSGSDYERSKALFQRIGFQVTWSTEGLCELAWGGNAFLLQDYHHKEMQENFMMMVNVDDLDAFYQHLLQLELSEHFPEVRFKEPKDMPWGNRELHFIDIAGVCWHFM